jgi:hypothetical protein
MANRSLVTSPPASPGPDLYVPVRDQLTAAQLPPGDGLEPSALGMIRLNTPLRGGTFRKQALENSPRNPNHLAVCADLDPELHGLPLGIPAGSRGEQR